MTGPLLRVSLLAALAATPAAAATYTINIGNPLDIGSVAAAPAGDTVFTIDAATGSVNVASGSGRRISTGSVRALVTVICRPSRGTDTTCRDDKLNIQVGGIGALIGRARALNTFTVSMGTATLVSGPTGTSPLNFQLAPLGDTSPKTFYVGANFPVAGDDSGLATGTGENTFYATVLNNAGVNLASDTDKGKVKVFRALTVAKTADLGFGRIQIPSSGTSTVAINASTGVRTISGNAVAYPTPAPTRAAFTITGEGGQQVSVNIPSGINLTGPGTLPVTVTTTASASPNLSGVLGAAGSYSFNVGGSFTISPTTPTGAYAGILTVSIDYN